MVSRRTFLSLGIAAGGLAVAGGGTAFAYSRAIAEAEAWISPTLSTVIASRFGDLEYAEAGSGTPLLMIHGTGGGFDQGLFFARRFSQGGYRVVAPSRFGYLRSSFPDDPSSENQADAFVDLLDRLGLDKVVVAGGSAGALSAMAFAIRHPDRTAALLPLVPASYVPRTTPPESVPPAQMQIAMALLKSDFLFWAGMELARDQLVRALLATDPELIRRASTEEQQRASHILHAILPVSARAQGLINDARLAGNPAPMAIQTITAPTLTISYADDRFGTADAARYLAGQIPGAQLKIYPDGGHIGIGHDAESFAEIDAFLNNIGYA